MLRPFGIERIMEIIIEPHTLERAEERGTNEAEIIDVIENGTSIRGKYGRLGKAKIFEYNKERLGKFYEQKRVEVFYTIENGIIVTITVYVFFGKWEG